MNGRLLASALLAPLIGALVTWLVPARSKRTLAWLNLLATLISLICIVLAHVGGNGQQIILQMKNAPLALNFQLDGLTAFLPCCFGRRTATSVYSFAYMEREAANRRFYVFLQLTLLGCVGVVLASDFLTLFVFSS